jgi:hypothetical protein
LLVERGSKRLYVEIKRENPIEHQRLLRIQEVSGIINSRLDGALRAWLRQKGLRLEIKFSRLFSNAYVERVVEEILAKATDSQVSTERELQSVRDSKIILLQRDAEFFYQKGLHCGFVCVEVAGQAVPLFAPASTPVRTTFALWPNFNAVGDRVRMAGRQLSRDLERDNRAEGLVVLECTLGDAEIVETIQKRFWSRLPPQCWGVTLISPTGWIIPRSDLGSEQIEIMKYAAQDPA